MWSPAGPTIGQGVGAVSSAEVRFVPVNSGNLGGTVRLAPNAMTAVCWVRLGAAGLTAATSADIVVVPGRDLHVAYGPSITHFRVIGTDGTLFVMPGIERNA